MIPSRHPGYTFVEAIVVLVVVALFLAATAPAARRPLDGFATRAARDDLATAVARTRSAGIARGGARLVVHLDDAGYHIEYRDGQAVTDFQDLGSAYGVHVLSDGAAGPRVAIDFDALGIGRLANRTFRVRRGDAEARLTLSAYGRVRRW